MQQGQHPKGPRVLLPPLKVVFSLSRGMLKSPRNKIAKHRIKIAQDLKVAKNQKSNSRNKFAKCAKKVVIQNWPMPGFVRGQGLDINQHFPEAKLPK